MTYQFHVPGETGHTGLLHCHRIETICHGRDRVFFAQTLRSESTRPPLMTQDSAFA